MLLDNKVILNKLHKNNHFKILLYLRHTEEICFLKWILLILRICSVGRHAFQSSGYKKAEHGDIYHQVRKPHCSLLTKRCRRAQYVSYRRLLC